MKQLALIVVLVLVLGIAGFLYRYTLERPDLNNPVACTLEARLCSDGSAVGRTGPNCEFAACPSPETATTTPETATSSPEAATSSPVI